MEEKTHNLALLEQRMSVKCVAADLQVTRMAIYSLKKVAAAHPPGTAPPRKQRSGSPKKTSTHTDRIFKREVTSDPSITAVGLKNKQKNILVSLKTLL